MRQRTRAYLGLLEVRDTGESQGCPYVAGPHLIFWAASSHVSRG